MWIWNIRIIHYVNEYTKSLSIGLSLINLLNWLQTEVTECKQDTLQTSKATRLAIHHLMSRVAASQLTTDKWKLKFMTFNFKIFIWKIPLVTVTMKIEYRIPDANVNMCQSPITNDIINTIIIHYPYKYNLSIYLIWILLDCCCYLSNALCLLLRGTIIGNQNWTTFISIC